MTYGNVWNSYAINSDLPEPREQESRKRRVICRRVDWYSATVEMVTVTYRNMCGEQRTRVLVMRDGRKNVYRDIVRIGSKFG